ncbi:unnamed protein product, partial [Brenthis ino]
MQATPLSKKKKLSTRPKTRPITNTNCHRDQVILYCKLFQARPTASSNMNPPSPPSSPSSPSNNPALEAGPSCGPAAPTLNVHSYVALLKELCEEYHLREPEYKLIGDTSPAHERHFTEKRRVEAAKRVEVAAAGAAAGAAVGAGGDSPWRIDPNQRLADFHLDDEKRAECLRVLAGEEDDDGGEDEDEKLVRVCAVLGLSVERVSLGPVAVRRLVPTRPPLAFAGYSPRDAAGAALRYVHRVLTFIH